MADWPRWLEENVDSQAMLSAFQWYLHNSKTMVGPLPITIHRNSEAWGMGLEEPPAPPGTFSVACQAPACERNVDGVDIDSSGTLGVGWKGTSSS